MPEETGNYMDEPKYTKSPFSTNACSHHLILGFGQKLPDWLSSL